MPNRRRLARLRSALRDRQPKLDMAAWPTCAAGFACTLDEFQAEGLWLYDSLPCYWGVADWAAIDGFFDLSRHQTTFIFSARSYEQDEPTANDVAARIDEFLFLGALPMRWAA